MLSSAATVLRNPMQPSYNGPFKVLHRGEKTPSLQMNDRVETVSADRLTAASLGSSFTSHPLLPQCTPLPLPHSVQPPDPARRTRSGRRVHFLVRYQCYTHFNYASKSPVSIVVHPSPSHQLKLGVSNQSRSIHSTMDPPDELKNLSTHVKVSLSSLNYAAL